MEPGEELVAQADIHRQNSRRNSVIDILNLMRCSLSFKPQGTRRMTSPMRHLFVVSRSLMIEVVMYIYSVVRYWVRELYVVPDASHLP